MENMKIVDFTKCIHCIHKDKKEYEEPCFECLEVSAREDSHMPINFDDGKKRQNL